MNDVSGSVAWHVETASRQAALRWDKPRARSMRRAYAAGYWIAAMIRGTSPLVLHVDEANFVSKVDAASHDLLTA